MSYSIGDGLVALSIAATIVGCLYVKHRTRQHRIEIIHQERLAAMEKGIPLPEFPLDSEHQQRPQDQTVVPLLGVVLFTLSLGAMIVLSMTPGNRSFWIAPLPFLFLGGGFIAYHYLSGRTGR